MAVPVDAVTRADVDRIRYDDLSFETTYGRVGVTVFMPSVQQVSDNGMPEVSVVYSAGWGEGRGAAEVACQALVRAANTIAVMVTYPNANLRVHDIVPFRTRILSAVIRRLKTDSPYDEPGLVVVGYSRGTVPARHAALEHAAQVRGLSLVAPTWFQGEVRPRELATKGLAEGARGILRESWVDKWGLIAASARLAQEMVAHPIALRNDVAAIAEEGATDLHQVLAAGIRVGVVAGRNDELCEVGGIRRVIDEPEIRGRVDYREAESDHFCYFLKPAPLRVVADQIGRLAIPTT